MTQQMWHLFLLLACLIAVAIPISAEDVYAIELVKSRGCGFKEYLSVTNVSSCSLAGPFLTSAADKTLWKLSLVSSPPGSALVKLRPTPKSLKCRGFLASNTQECSNAGSALILPYVEQQALWYLTALNGISKDKPNQFYFLNKGRNDACVSEDVIKQQLIAKPSCSDIRPVLGSLDAANKVWRLVLQGGTAATKRPKLDVYYHVGVEYKFNIEPPEYGSPPVAYRVCAEPLCPDKNNCPLMPSCKDYEQPAPFSGELAAYNPNECELPFRLYAFGLRAVGTQTPVVYSETFTTDTCSD